MMTVSKPPSTSREKVWLISSGDSTIGRALAKRVLVGTEFYHHNDNNNNNNSNHHDCPCDLVALSVNDPDIDAVRDSILGNVPLHIRSSISERLMIIYLDQGLNSSCQECVAQILNNWSKIDILVNCSYRTIAGSIDVLTAVDAQRQMESSYFGPTNLIRAVLPCMRRRLNGHILNFTGVLGTVGMPCLSLLSAGCHALEGYTEALSFEIAPFNIRTTIVKPQNEVFIPSCPVEIIKPEVEAQNKMYHLLRHLDSNPTILIDQVVNCLVQIAGVENPPTLLVIGTEAIDQIKENLSALSEELEMFSATSYRADVGSPD